MFKKFLGSILCFLMCSTVVFANDLAGVQSFFQSYVDSANSYNPKLLDLYLPDAKIIRVVIKPDGTKQSVILPTAKYKQELSMGQKAAKIVGYKNDYSDKKYDKLGNGDYKISAMRTPSKDNSKLASHFVVTKTASGDWKIKEESMETTVQKFLKGNN